MTLDQTIRDTFQSKILEIFGIEKYLDNNYKVTSNFIGK